MIMGFLKQVFGGAFNNRESFAHKRCQRCGKFSKHHIQHIAYPDGSRGWVEERCMSCGHTEKY